MATLYQEEFQLHSGEGSCMELALSMFYLCLKFNSLQFTVVSNYIQMSPSLKLTKVENQLRCKNFKQLSHESYTRFCSFTDNSGLCGIPGLPTCGAHLSVGAKIGIGLACLAALVLISICSTCWWKRRQNILRAQRIAGKSSDPQFVAWSFWIWKNRRAY